ncbi:putative DNA modification/repair radical SAM protein [Syntrophomonas palmitatica]|uniref:putative DNA modification/repair radical SAM protein n=1 Tax=Syntrophomonas palmitatica TaxID=402877 RepID=UPI0006D165A8|nr:putative DNA modification/repair radical SAM protein [Syntrophomonas palmitatica]
MTKLSVLTGAAKYDVSCASSGISRGNAGGMGSTVSCGICHAWSEDGRCISLLKVLLSNDCIYDCRYCVNRRSNDVPRASFTAREIADLTMQFYRRNYIEGLFLSSAVEKSPNYTMEKVIQVLTELRQRYEFFGYIHIKIIPGADPNLVYQAGLLADRMSVNIEQPSEESLRLMAPQKSLPMVYSPMKQVKEQIIINREDRRHFRHTPKFAPAGQSTQMIIGASQDSDLTILQTTQNLYQNYKLKRVYYSAYVPVNEDSNLPSLATAPPLLREHRLYQSDWLLRYYHFTVDEIVDPSHAYLETDVDPKMSWALRHPEYFPLEINRASYEELLRVPGIGVKSARRIMSQRRLAYISADDLKKLGVAYKRAQYFITCKGVYSGNKPFDPLTVRRILAPPQPQAVQLSLF